MPAGETEGATSHDGHLLWGPGLRLLGRLLPPKRNLPCIRGNEPQQEIPKGFLGLIRGLLFGTDQ